ncbi:class I SAM-dependent methyltransferase [Nocardioides speluncae]|uniref:class I SAM-dependent methyltransferase n=1 Tax=Nocardioides speluncae TaxID=2670337 RepID=UPI000D68DB1B|nr:class I SAM-dependent methyltransferase [Nocardioides speluncae]
MTDDGWISGDPYERYIGRWSSLVAREFLDWIGPPAGPDWLDVGCGAGALTAAIVETQSPRWLAGVDPSAGFLDTAHRRLAHAWVELRRADAVDLPYEPESFDRVVSGLVLNFIPDQPRALAEMRRVLRPGGEVAGYVWDYAGKMELIGRFWEAAVALDPAAADLDERTRFPSAAPDPLRELFEGAGLDGVEVRAIEVTTDFADFDDYWTPFLGGQGPAPAYCMSLAEDARAELRERLRSALPARADGSIELVARAWAVRGRKPAG